MSRAPRSASPMEELNQVPIAELTNVMPSMAWGPAESTLTRVKNRRSRRRSPAPDCRSARCRSRRVIWKTVTPRRTRGRARATRSAMDVVPGSAPAIVVMKVREKAMITPIRMTKRSTRASRPREVFSVMAILSATRFTARPSVPRGWCRWRPSPPC